MNVGLCCRSRGRPKIIENSFFSLQPKLFVSLFVHWFWHNNVWAMFWGFWFLIRCFDWEKFNDLSKWKLMWAICKNALNHDTNTSTHTHKYCRKSDQFDNVDYNDAVCTFFTLEWQFDGGSLTAKYRTKFKIEQRQIGQSEMCAHSIVTMTK